MGEPGALRMTGRALRAEWTKLRSVRSSWLALLAMIALTMLLSLVAASLSTSNANQTKISVDQFHFVHQPMAGDGTVTARVAAQADSGAWAKAGLMIKDGTRSGSSYAAIMVTPDHGVLMQADAKTELTAPSATGPRWLRLTRTGQSVTGYESADGSTWNTVGTLTVSGQPAGGQAGLFVANPPKLHLLGIGGGRIPNYEPFLGEASFADVSLTPAAGRTWQDTEVAPAENEASHRAIGEGAPFAPVLEGSSTWAADGSVTVTGSGDIGRAGMGGINLTDVDRVRAGLIGIQFGLIGAIAIGALFMTAEFKTKTIRTTFVARPRRTAVLAAKSIVLAGVVFLTGLAVTVPAYFITRPMQAGNGYTAPIYPESSFSDPAVLRAVLGASAFLALIALFSLAVGTIVRRTAGAVIILLSLLVIVPTIAGGTSESAYAFINRTTPLAGISILQTVELSPLSTAVVTGTWTGFAVLCGYTVAALAAAFWLLRRRDV
ncbi:ABC transporter permease subunit [Micromonospora chersina]|uniref:ABC transporter permease subunit n=1 Tax=Micromonospora chersina TaxID=47854 RepID=UPI003710DEFA